MQWNLDLKKLMHNFETIREISCGLCLEVKVEFLRCVVTVFWVIRQWARSWERLEIWGK